MSDYIKEELKIIVEKINSLFQDNDILEKKILKQKKNIEQLEKKLRKLEPKLLKYLNRSKNISSGSVTYDFLFDKELEILGLKDDLKENNNELNKHVIQLIKNKSELKILKSKYQSLKRFEFLMSNIR